MIYNLNYINSLIVNKVEESLNLEYKGAAALDRQNNKTTEISKDISSFANSDGGIIIYGIKEDENNKHLPKEIDPIDRTQFSKEWLEQIILDKIKPRVKDFTISVVEVVNSYVVYIVDIKKSNTAHQADDKRYYRRFNFQSTAMYDYEIRDILNRAQHPIISLKFEHVIRGNRLIISAVNSGPMYANYLNVVMRVSQAAVVDDNFKSIYDRLYEFSVENTVRDAIDVKIAVMGGDPIYTYGPSRYKPILPTRTFKLKELSLKDFAFDYENIIEWEIYCDSAPPIIGSTRFCETLKK